MKDWQRRLAVALSLIGLVLTGATPASAASTTATYTVWDWNISGNIMHAGSTTDGLAGKAVSSIVNRDADFVSLNEVCFGQYRAIQQGLVQAGWPLDPTNFSRFAATRTPTAGLCDGEESFGLALFSKRALGSSRQYELPQDDRMGTKKMLCAPLAAEARMKFCTVHITTSNLVQPGQTQPDNVRQLDAVREILDGFDAAGETYLIAGDFNAQPHYGRLNGYYAPTANTVNNPNNKGTHRELDDADDAHCPGYGEWTADGSTGAEPCGGNAKVDHIFARESRIAGPYSADSLAVPNGCTVANPPTGSTDPTLCSDHRVLVGTVPVLIG